jgi:hypothetical protein
MRAVKVTAKHGVEAASAEQARVQSTTLSEACCTAAAGEPKIIICSLVVPLTDTDVFNCFGVGHAFQTSLAEHHSLQLHHQISIPIPETLHSFCAPCGSDGRPIRSAYCEQPLSQTQDESRPHQGFKTDDIAPHRSLWNRVSGLPSKFPVPYRTVQVASGSASGRASLDVPSNIRFSIGNLRGDRGGVRVRL